MNKKDLKTIDFSNGIRCLEIEHNFKVIQEEIERERISTAGVGISFGLSVSVNDFKLKIEDGCVIDSKGKEIFIDGIDTDIELPILYSTNSLGEKQLDEDENIYLEHTPYSINRKTIAEHDSIEYSGIQVKTEDTDVQLQIVSVNGNVVTVNNPNKMFSNKKLNIEYFITEKRLDLIAINNKYEIEIIKGISSSSPSFLNTENEDFIAILGFIKIEPFFKDENDKIKAKASFIKSSNNIRNIYTDDKNNLYLCGTPFSSIKVIHLAEPKNPNEYDLWYDDKTNQLKIYRRTDNNLFTDKILFTSENPNHNKIFKTNVKYLYNNKQIKVFVNDHKVEIEEGPTLLESEKKANEIIFINDFRIIDEIKTNDIIRYEIDRYDGFCEWVPLNSTSFLTSKEIKLWKPEKNRNNRFFIFNYKKDFNCLFIPHKNCLDIVIDQIPLHSDQFKEITLKEVASGKYDYLGLTYKKLIEEFDYLELDKTINEEDIGIGFEIFEELDTSDSYIETRIMQRYNVAPISSRFQRSATFVNSNSIKYNKFKNENDINLPVFNTSISYKYNEKQLDVYLNGIKLIKDIDYEEGSDLKEKLQGADSFLFSIFEDKIKDGDIVEYKITTNVYSYDHLESLLGNMEESIDRLKLNIKSTEDILDTKKEEIDIKISDMNEALRRIEQSTQNFNLFLSEADDLVKNTFKDIDSIKNEIFSTSEDINNKMDILNEASVRLDNMLKNFDNSFLKKNEKINLENLDKEVTDKFIKKQISFKLEKDNKFSFLISEKCKTTDYVEAIDVTDKIRTKLIRDLDYRIYEKEGNTYFEIVNNELINKGIIYVSGLSF